MSARSIASQIAQVLFVAVVAAIAIAYTACILYFMVTAY